jgi:hypothetical protein
VRIPPVAAVDDLDLQPTVDVPGRSAMIVCRRRSPSSFPRKSMSEASPQVREEYFENEATGVEVEDLEAAPGVDRPWNPADIRVATRQFSWPRCPTVSCMSSWRLSRSPWQTATSCSVGMRSGSGYPIQTLETRSIGHCLRRGPSCLRRIAGKISRVAGRTSLRELGKL